MLLSAVAALLQIQAKMLHACLKFTEPVANQAYNCKSVATVDL